MVSETLHCEYEACILILKWKDEKYILIEKPCASGYIHDMTDEATRPCEFYICLVQKFMFTELLGRGKKSSRFV